MTLRGLVFIGLRFYAVSLLAGVIPILPTLIAFMSQAGMTNQAGIPSAVWMILSVPLAYLSMAAVLWLAAGRLASGIAREFNQAVQLQMTLEEVLTFAFVFVGLYFVLNSVASTVIQLFSLLTVMGRESYQHPEQTRAITDLYRSGITLIAGLASLLGSRAWARKLTRRGLKVDEKLP